MKRLPLLGAVLGLAWLVGAAWPAVAQYRPDEASFEPWGQYLTEYIVERPSSTDVERVEQPPALSCLGLGEDPPNTPEGFAPAVAVELDAAASESVAAFRAGNYVSSVEGLRTAIGEADPEAFYVLSCVMDGLASARYRRPQHSDVPPHSSRSAVERAIALSRTVGGRPRTAVEWLIASADAGFLPARWELARRWANWRTAYTRSVTVTTMRRLAASGDARAAALLGHFYLVGRDVPQDFDEAVRLTTSAAEAGDALGMLILSNLYRDGRAGLRDDRLAVQWLERAAAGGNARAAYYLAGALARGEGTEPDIDRAVRLYVQAAEQGQGDAAYELSILHGPEGARPDPTAADNWLRRGEELGSCWTRLELARRQLAGIDRNDRDAVRIVRDGLNRCDPDWSDGVQEPGERTTDLAQEARWRAQHAQIDHALAGGAVDFESLGTALESGDPRRVEGALRTLGDLASAFGHATGPEEYPPGAAHALAVLAFPAASLPAEVKARIDSNAWRARIRELRDNDKVALISAALDASLVRQDIPAFLGILGNMARDSSGSRDFLLRRFGLWGGGYLSVLRRLDRGEDRHEIDLELAVMTWNCTPTYLFAEFISAMRRFPPSCNGADALVNLPTSVVQRISELGVGLADLFLSERYLEGRGIERQPQRAVAMLENLRGPISNALLGVIYEEGRGLPDDPSRAALYYRQALGTADVPIVRYDEGQGTIAARLGSLMLDGLGLPADPERAARLLLYSATAGVLVGETAYGDVLYVGAGAERDEAEGLRWYRQAARDGEPTALVRFGFLAATNRWNERGLGAQLWYAAAARSGTANAYIDLARAAAFGPRPKVREVRSWLHLAAERNDMRAIRWLSACDGRPASCFKSQAGFGRLFFVRMAPQRAEPHVRPRTAGRATAAARLSADLRSLGHRVEAIDAHHEGTNAMLSAFVERERIETWHGDAAGALETRVRRLLFQDSALSSRHGSLDSYFALVESSCNWGLASQAAERIGRPEAALLFAKIAVNRLQAARRNLEGLDEELRECFVEVHRDRYRWFADLLVTSRRLAEAETVLGMLKDFEHSTYTGDPARRRSSDGDLAYSGRERPIASRIDRLMDAWASEGAPPSHSPDQPAAHDTPSASEGGFMQEIDAIVQAVVALDGVPGPSRTRIGAEAVASVRDSVSVEFDPRLPARTAALHVLVLDTRIHWIVSTRLGRWAITIDGPASEIDGGITDLLEAIRMRLPFARIRARSLYRRVFAPVDRLLTSQGVHHVMLSLDGRLRYVPFAALFDGHRWLIEKYSFSQFRRPEDYLRETDRADWNIAAFGASTAIAGQEALPDVARELAGIVRTSDAADAGIVPGIEMLDQAFTREALAGAVTGGYRVIHIASHFILNPAEANGSFLLLGDGSRLSLQDFRRDGIFSFMHTALVTLSACQTAIASRHGTGLEIDSMATIAQDAGAPAVIASLWSVADSSTADLMLSLYSYRVTDRLPLAESLRRAQLDIISGRRSPRNDNARPRHQAGATLEEPRDHPFYWAAFILMGDPR